MRSPDLEAGHGRTLLELARRSMEHGLVHHEALPVHLDALPPALAEPAATFTTLRLHGELRGCCGTLEASRPLATDVAWSAFRAAYRDPRFDPVREDEVDVVRLEVSVLSAPEPLPVTGEADLLGKLVPGIDGLVIDDGGQRATFLPKVWESLPEPRMFLAALKTKCGLPADYWSDRFRFERYRATTCSEADTAGAAQPASVTYAG